MYPEVNERPDVIDYVYVYGIFFIAGVILPCLIIFLLCYFLPTWLVMGLGFSAVLCWNVYKWVNE